jgi:hypothetical protein
MHSELSRPMNLLETDADAMISRSKNPLLLP